MNLMGIRVKQADSLEQENALLNQRLSAALRENKDLRGALRTQELGKRERLELDKLCK